MKKIMIVDDNPDLRFAVKLILDDEDYDTVIALDGDDCLEKLKNMTIKPDLILLDVMMPGTLVAEVIKQIEGIKIAFLSAVSISDKDKEGLLLQKNVVDFIPKPFGANELLEKVKKILGE